VISHFHADHIAGLKDFPSSKIWCSRKSLAYALSRNKFNAVFKGILKPLIPDNILNQAMYPEDRLSISAQSNLIAWKWSEDLYFVDLPGHYRGQLGLYLKNTNIGDLLLCADAVWSVKAIREKIYPSRLVSLIIDDFSQLSRTIDDLYNFQKENPEVRILPTHCDETLKVINN
jgi:glyoxylase-like metal-dependent hydrolase (beta-lactamase superfamily II)